MGSFKATADPYTVIHHFMPGGHDGALPSNTQLVSDGSAAYGVTPFGGRASGGVVFRLVPGGTDFQILDQVRRWPG